MGTFAALCGLILLAVILWDTFETIVLPRSVTRSLRFTRLFYRFAWALWSAAARKMPRSERRAELLGSFGPLSLILLLGVWAVCLMLGFALLQYGLSTGLSTPDGRSGFGTYLYMSGVTLFTLGFGDVVPRTSPGRGISVAEAGVGIGFLAMVIGYLPVLYQAFSRREVGISLLDARAGSPPTGVELLRRHAAAGQMAAVAPLLQQWEQWAAELLESHLSYPVLMYYRSQHDRESWLAALTAILDACALIEAGFADGPPADGHRGALVWQARMTYAMARHAVVDLALILGAEPMPTAAGRLEPAAWEKAQGLLASAGLDGSSAESKERVLERVRGDYEPYVAALAGRLLVALPGWAPSTDLADNWQTSAWPSVPHF